MSGEATDDPIAGNAASCEAVETVIVPRTSEIGGFEVRRALPSVGKRMVGPFVFFDQMGPCEFLLGAGLDVSPHPHIGLATVTYLFDGEILHRDSIGTEQVIRPGDVNWMTAGRGVAHSERTPEGLRAAPGSVFGIQTWVALPEGAEENAPAFSHHGAGELPVISDRGTEVRLITGSLYGATSPVRTYSETIYADAALRAGHSLPLDPSFEERAIYVLSGEIEIAGDRFEAPRLLVFRPGDRITIRAVTDSRLLILGGAPLESRRYIWWNFVSSRRERIEDAREAWKAGRFDLVQGEAPDDFVPAPEGPAFRIPARVNYP
ncbi:hypothetical protein SAMN05216548_101266 [Faunimonas pinastri]|uniref:Pirin n=1 Tax=Faunimonas pinastri TaxID=1855383 RepID=A0A1H8ZXN6_9HYPH|nr:pirin family protein [Faunimonas pinastri]SEP69007.1 hypothetical protein SAMN05216548_101266 [Faunimonas pinastri]